MGLYVMECALYVDMQWAVGPGVECLLFSPTRGSLDVHKRRALVMSMGVVIREIRELLVFPKIVFLQYFIHILKLSTERSLLE